MSAAPKRYEEILSRDGVLVYKGMGNSMLPSFRPDRDLMIVVPVAGRLRRCDVVLYRRPDGRYVLHRVLSALPHGYAVRGDNCVKTEYVAERQVLGVMTAFVRDGVRIEVTDWRYRVQVRIWLALYPLRKLWSVWKRSCKRT